MLQKRRNEILLGLFFLLVLGLLAYMFHAIGGSGGPGRVRVVAVFDNASGLVPNNAVMVAGVPVGTVEHIEVDFDKARATLSLEPNAGLRNDVQARIRAKSLLGEKYVEIVPASHDAPLLKDGDVLTKTDSPMEIDQVFGALRPFFEKLDPMAPKIDALLAELDTLLGQLNEVGHNKREVLERILDRTDALLGEANTLLNSNEERIGRTLASLEKLSASGEKRLPALLDRAESALSRVEEVAKAVPVETMKKIPDSYAKLDRILDHLEPLAERMERSGTRVEQVLTKLDVLLGRLMSVDELAIRKFLQEEGVNINLTQDEESKKRIEELEKEQVKKK